MPDITSSQQRLLEWLAKEDSSALGECHGADLDELVKRGLAEIKDPERGDFARVSLTSMGQRLAAATPAEVNVTIPKTIKFPQMATIGHLGAYFDWEHPETATPSRLNMIERRILRIEMLLRRAGIEPESILLDEVK